MPMRARNPLNEVAAPEIPVPVFGATGVLSAPGPGVFSPATTSVVVVLVAVAVGGTGVLVAFGGTVVLVGVAAGVVGVGVGVLTMSGLQFVQSGVMVGGAALVFITQTSVSWPVLTAAEAPLV